MFQKIDKHGRLVIPKSIRVKLGLTPGTELRISVVKRTIVITKEKNEIK